ncbi:NAD(P)-binding protein [Dendrothele bispora CBS 962.96]|uniref:NAD(P)-binding protein n=1 Tax=Dendrothele bispora (strain CBS 962.96) TaxID=1314807 RepID=A0A4S8L268_DENBC|nr:NAD(P)-binding protein [Dendrothele bispora CBS 962.96]
MPKPIVLVTGGTGFVGSHVISQLLAQNVYTVRAVARSASKLRAIFPDSESDGTAGRRLASSNFEAVEIPSLTSDYTEALKNVQSVIHIASPLYQSGISGEDIFQGAYHGTLHLVQQAIDAGVKKIVITGTFATLYDVNFAAVFGTQSLTEKDYGPAIAETIDLQNPNKAAIYQQSKTAADKKLWEIAHAHPDVDITILLPPAIFGPLVPNYPLTSRASIGTNDIIYQLFLSGPENYPNIPFGHMVDVRDIARAHLAALSASPVPGRNKRLIVAYGTFTWKALADLIRKERPEVADRVPREDAPIVPQGAAPLDTSFAKEILGMDQYIGWEETMLAAVDVLLEFEKSGKNIADPAHDYPSRG